MRVYLTFLRTPYAVRLLGGTLLGRLPNGMASLAIVLFVRAHGGGYTLAGALSAVYGLAMAVGQPVLGRAMDRYGQPRILLGAAALAAAGFGLLALGGVRPVATATAACVLAGFATPPLEPGLRALWPHVLAGPREVHTAYALDAAAQELLYTFGPLLVVAATAVSEEAALLLTGALGVAGTLIVASSRPSRSWRGHATRHHWAGPLRSRGLLVMIAAFAWVGVALGAIGVAVVAYADAHGRSYASGLLLALYGAGALIGGLAYGARPRTGPAGRRLLPLVAGLAAGYVPLALAPPLPLMAALTVLSGVFLAPALACGFTLVDGLAPHGTVTEAFGWLIAAFCVGSAAGAALGGAAGDRAGVHGAYAIAGAAGVLALLILLAGRRTLHVTRAEATAHGATTTA